VFSQLDQAVNATADASVTIVAQVQDLCKQAEELTR